MERDGREPEGVEVRSEDQIPAAEREEERARPQLFGK